jgi:hypothetical protein
VRAPRWVAVKPVRTRPPVHHGEGEGPVALPLPPVPPSRVTARSAQAPPLLPWIRGPSAKAWRWSERRRRARGRGRRPPPSQRLCPGAGGSRSHSRPPARPCCAPCRAGRRRPAAPWRHRFTGFAPNAIAASGWVTEREYPTSVMTGTMPSMGIGMRCRLGHFFDE